MMVYQVPAEELIEALTDYIKKNVKTVRPPEWAYFVKTGVHAERPPTDPDWWYKRAASILRKLYVKGPVGVSRLRSEYGGRKRRGVKPAHHYDGSANILRKVMQQLEEAGFVEKTPKGRALTSKGRTLLNTIAREIAKERPLKKWYEIYPVEGEESGVKKAVEGKANSSS